jgi:hypothetical protein
MKLAISVFLPRPFYVVLERRGNDDLNFETSLCELCRDVALRKLRHCPYARKIYRSDETCNRGTRQFGG